MGNFGNSTEGGYRMKPKKEKQMKQMKQVRRKERKREGIARRVEAEKRRDELKAAVEEEKKRAFRDLLMLLRGHFDMADLVKDDDLVEVTDIDDYRCNLCSHFKDGECEGKDLAGRTVLECLVEHHTSETDDC